MSLYTITRLEEVRGLFRANATAPALVDFNVESMCRHNMRVLTVHMFNPWVTEETLVCYLSRYVTILPGVRDIKDALGIWTGKRQFRVLLREDESGHDGYRHPPASFSIGADRGYLMYAGQPRFCRKCSTYGHLADACSQTRCRNCGTIGHTMRDCTVPKRCSLCNSEDHLFRHCPKAVPSYARAVSGKRAQSGKRPDEGEGMELRAIDEVVDELVMERELRESEESGSETPSSSHEERGEAGSSWNKQVEEEKGEPTAPAATESWTTVRERRKCSVKRKQMSPVSPLIRMEATEKSALGGNRFSCFESGKSEEKSEGNLCSAEETLLSLSGAASIESSGLAPSGVPAPTQMEGEHEEEDSVFPTPVLVDSPPTGDHRFPDRPPNELMYLK